MTLSLTIIEMVRVSRRCKRVHQAFCSTSQLSYMQFRLGWVGLGYFSQTKRGSMRSCKKKQSKYKFDLCMFKFIIIQIQIHGVFIQCFMSQIFVCLFWKEKFSPLDNSLGIWPRLPRYATLIRTCQYTQFVFLTSEFNDLFIRKFYEFSDQIG